jgi:hypothetical protein
MISRQEMKVINSNKRTSISLGRKWIHIERRTPKGWRVGAYEKTVITPSSRKRLESLMFPPLEETQYRNGDRRLSW